MSIIGTGIARATRIFRESKVVTFATMYAMKNRPFTHPSIIHLSGFAQAAERAQMLLVAATWTALHDRIYRAAGGRVLTADDFDKFNNNKK